MRRVVPPLVLGALQILFWGCGGEDDGGPMQPQPGPSASMPVRSGQGAVISNNQGIALSVFPNSVPTNPAGGTGELVFSIEPSQVLAAAPPGFTAAGSVWQFGPEGINLSQRCRMTFPVADSTKVYALGRFNPVGARWEIVPAISRQGRRGVISGDVKHFSTWSVFAQNASQIDPTGMGAIHVKNLDPTRHVSLCVASYTLASPAQYPGFDPASVGCLVSEAGHNGGAFGLQSEVDMLVAQGTWVFEATRTKPIDPLRPAGPDGWITLPPITVNAPWAPGQSAQALDLNPSSWDGVSLSPPYAPCEGAPDFSFGTGDVQITLTWDEPVDLDLHVIDPQGEEIWFADRTSSSGGMLDRDTICEGGKPENVFWPENGAPRGAYIVNVHLYSLCDMPAGPIPFRIRTVVDGTTRTFSGSATTEDEVITVTSFTR